MSRASELANGLRQKYSGAIVDLQAADELERLERVNAELVEAARLAWATLHNLSVDMDPTPIRQQMQKRARALRDLLDRQEQFTSATKEQQK